MDGLREAKGKWVCAHFLSISVCRLRERGRMSKSVYVRVVHDLELLRMFFIVRSNDSFNFPLGLIKYIVIAPDKCLT